MQPGNLRPSPLVQSSDGCDQRISLILKRFSRLDILELDSPLRCACVPSCLQRFVPQLHVFAAVIFLSHPLPVLQNLGGFGVKGSPCWIGLKGQLVAVGGNIYGTVNCSLMNLEATVFTTSTARVLVLEPCSPQLLVLVVYDEIEIS